MRWLTLWVAVVFLLIQALSPVQASEDEIELLYLAPGDNDLEFELNALGIYGPLGSLRDKGAVSAPDVSPDGHRIAFSGYRTSGADGRYPLWVVGRDGKNLVQLTDPIGADWDPEWSPNGKKIAFSRDIEGGFNPSTCCDIWTVNPDGSGASEIPNTQGGINPSWSPDGNSIAFESPAGIHLINTDGSGKVQVAPPGSREPAWSPTGKYVAYIRETGSFDPPHDQLVWVNLDTGNVSLHYSPGTRIESINWNGAALDVVTFAGYGYSDRTNAKVRRVTPGVGVKTIFSGESEMVFLSEQPTRCLGDNVEGGTGGGSDIEGVSAAGDCFGYSLTSGDFNGDGFEDVATGAPGDIRAGAVNVVFGSSSGLVSAGDQRFDQGSPGVAGNQESDDRFAEALASGDFNGDGIADLAVGVPGEDIGNKVDAGGVAVLFGSTSGLTSSTSDWYTQDSPGIAGTTETDDRFGEALAAADFNGDGFDDLAIGVPGEGLGSEDDAGGVAIMYGSSGGLTASSDDWLTQDKAGLTSDPDDRFGSALVASTLDAGSAADLAVGVPGEDVGSKIDAGGVAVFFGSGSGLDSGNRQWFNQDSPGVAGNPETDDRLGEAIAAGDFNRDGFSDLAVGVPFEDLGSKADAGGFFVLYGSASGVTASASDWYTQESAGVAGNEEADDRFSAALAAGDFDGDGFWDLAVGVVGEDLGGRVDDGGFVVLSGSSGGLVGTGEPMIHQASSGVSGAGEADDRFGFALVAGFFDGGSFADLAVGIPGEDIGGLADAGGFQMFLGTSIGISTTGSKRFDQ